jgi:hypothetical protein
MENTTSIANTSINTPKVTAVVRWYLLDGQMILPNEIQEVLASRR